LEPFNLSTLRQKWGQERLFSAETARLRWRYTKEFKELEGKIELITENLTWGGTHVLRKSDQNVGQKSSFA